MSSSSQAGDQPARMDTQASTSGTTCSSKVFKEPVFSFWLNRNSGDEEGREIVFGGVDRKHYKDEHTYVPVKQEGYWQDCALEVVQRLLILGTSLLVGPSGIITQINHAIEADGVISQECKAVQIKEDS